MYVALQLVADLNSQYTTRWGLANETTNGPLLSRTEKEQMNNIHIEYLQQQIDTLTLALVAPTEDPKLNQLRQEATKRQTNRDNKQEAKAALRLLNEQIQTIYDEYPELYAG